MNTERTQRSEKSVTSRGVQTTGTHSQSMYDKLPRMIAGNFPSPGIPCSSSHNNYTQDIRALPLSTFSRVSFNGLQNSASTIPIYRRQIYHLCFNPFAKTRQLNR